MNFSGTTKYADAVAAVKAMEGALLTTADIDQLTAASTKAELQSLIDAKRGSGEVFSLETVWEFIQGYASDCPELKLLLYKNDFHDLKAALKALIAGKEPKDYYVRPTNLDLEVLSTAVSRKSYELLPEYIAVTAREAYELLTMTLDGQLSDSLIDRRSIERLTEGASKSHSEFIKRYAALTADCADIKTAYRCALMKKSRDFTERTLTGCGELDMQSLLSASLEGTEALFEYLAMTEYDEGAQLLSHSPAAFEKWCDDELMKLAEEARLGTFGYEPLAAFYIAAETGIKNLRIITVCKESGADRNTVTDRMRRLYV